MITTIKNWLHRLSHLEITTCLVFNKLNHYKTVQKFFSIISWLGNGIFWYIIILLLPIIYGTQALYVSLQMLLVGLICLGFYFIIKKMTSRIRPFELTDKKFIQNVAPLDKYSFPSGHTLQAVALSIVLLQSYPTWGLLVIPFTFFVALSRLILGLHYPSDVIGGALIGWLIAYLTLLIL